jgi:hypothetical protein
MIPLNRLSRSKEHRNLAGYLPNIQYDDGTVNESAKAKLQQAGLLFYETDK